MKKAFTLIEIMIVIMIVGILLTMIPYRLQSLEQHAKMSLNVQQFENTRDKTTLLMRQGRMHETLHFMLGGTGIILEYTGGIQATGIELIPFDAELTLTPQEGLAWEMESYAVGCTGFATGFSLAYEKMSACFLVQTGTCSLSRIPCSRLNQ